MGNFNRDGGRSGGFRGGFDRGGRGGFGGGRSSFGGGRSFGRGGDRGGNRQMFKTTCSNCGKECEVPFRPTNGKPVYCSDCFEKMGNRSDTGRPEQNKNQFDAINAKLDKILGLLEPKIEVIPTLTSTEEAKIVKTKKTAKKTAAKK